MELTGQEKPQSCRDHSGEHPSSNATFPQNILFFGVAMDSFITLAAPFPGSVTEQPEIPFEQESGSGSGTSTSCTIA
ncbi:hypothetical protein PHLCEN_2v11676 [Hermanssonia centrifuga]|uniref:Uncharacterized protein n=1 Tax=Hermanssonia centrifuga TaxID=98765 RepID=A0A2R6NKB8_9APHY|nr:hypothetical protein PHLCEN_2v11676 [Hermanssonia centrifuga]